MKLGNFNVKATRLNIAELFKFVVEAKKSNRLKYSGHSHNGRTRYVILLKNK